MPLSPGDKLGPYEILALVGKGGMGEVYRAHDSRLNRDVAIKVSDAQFTERFTREARAIAALNHTNICHLYDVFSSSTAPNYLVMEYVEGGDLKGPLDFDDALPIIQQLIDGIEAAHEKNIIHRDLKPANIKITPEGVVKILDFGLAKATEPAPSGDANPENSPTLTIGATAVGAILGTAAYMAPEQAKGKQADKRSDVWSFGVVLYEVLTGKRLFTGETAVEILGAVLNREADITAAPPRVHKLLRWCLEKDRKQRLASISDARRLLAVDESETGSVAAASPAASRRPIAWMAAAAVLATIAAALGFGYYRATRPAEPKPLVRLNVDLGPDADLDYRSGTSVIISPDGTRLAFISQGRLFTQALDQPAAKELIGSGGAISPFFSPDGQWVGFFSGGKLKKISVAGGTAIELAQSNGAYTGAAWGKDGNIIAPLGAANPLMRIPEGGGTPVPILKLDAEKKEVTQRWPQILPGGKAVLFVSHTSGGGFDGANIDVVTLADGRRKTLQRGGLFGRYIPTFGKTGHLLFVNRGTLFAIVFDPETLETAGAPMPVIDDLAYSAAFGYAEFSFSLSGTAVHRGGNNETGILPQWLDSTGKTQQLLSRPGSYEQLSLSPDGSRLAVRGAQGSDVGSIWTYDWARDTMTRLTFDSSNPGNATWTPDGRFIAYDGLGLFVTRSDGAGKPTMLLPRGSPGSFTPDTKRLAYQQIGNQTQNDLWTVPIEYSGSTLKAGKPELFLQTPANEFTPTFSPDGKWIAYVSDESGVSQVYVRAFPDNGGKWQISGTTGLLPTWSHNGHELLYRTLDDQVMAVNYTTQGDSFAAEKPRVWTQKRLAPVGVSRNFGLSPDGKRIAALMSIDESVSSASRSHVIFLEDFFDELRRKAPLTGK